MSWEFEVDRGEDLSKIITDGLSPTTGEMTLQDVLDAASQKERGESISTGFGELAMMGYGSGYDTGGGYDSGGGTYDPNFPPGGSDPEPSDPLPNYDFDPDSPTGPAFDYSTIIDEELFASWTQAMGGYVDQQIGSWHHHDSLEEYMNGEWLFDLDPELIDYGNGDDYGYGSGYIEYGQYSPISYVGVPGGGGLVPIFSEWTEFRDIPAGQNENLSGIEVIHHTTFMGFERSRTYQVASLDDPFAFMGRVAEAFDILDLYEAWQNFSAAVNGAPNTQAIQTVPDISMANGMLMSAVMLDEVFVGHVMVNDHGFRLFDAHGNMFKSDLPLTQHWNQLDGVIYREEMAHQERVMGVPFAKALVGLGAVATGGLAGAAWWQSMSFGFATNVVSGGSAADATAYARLLEAAFELRAYELRNR